MSENDCKSDGPAFSWFVVEDWPEELLRVYKKEIRGSNFSNILYDQWTKACHYLLPTEIPWELFSLGLDADDEPTEWLLLTEDETWGVSLFKDDSETAPTGAWEAERGLTRDALGCVENTKSCGRSSEDGRLLDPSLLEMRWALSIAAAAAKCWMMRSSSSVLLMPTGNCITITKVRHHGDFCKMHQMMGIKSIEFKSDG